MFQRKLLKNKRARRDLNPRPLDSKNCGPSGREAATFLIIWEEVRNGGKNHIGSVGRSVDRVSMISRIAAPYGKECPCAARHEANSPE